MCDSLTGFARKVPVGDGLDEKNVLGPVQNSMQHGKVSRLVRAAKDAGGRVLLGGEEPDDGLFFPLTLIADLDNGNPLVDEEQFGPALPIIRYSNLDDAIAKANDNPNGLGGSIWSKDVRKARDLALQLECGTAWVNKHGAVQPNAPFGGVKADQSQRALRVFQGQRRRFGIRLSFLERDAVFQEHGRNALGGEPVANFRAFQIHGQLIVTSAGKYDHRYAGVFAFWRIDRHGRL